MHNLCLNIFIGLKTKKSMQTQNTKKKKMEYERKKENGMCWVRCALCARCTYELEHINEKERTKEMSNARMCNLSIHNYSTYI